MSLFGVPVTEKTLMEMSKYRGKTIKQADMGAEAMRMINAEGKNIKALECALKLKNNDYGNGVCTMCLIYNATGGRVDFVQKKDYDGYVYKDEPPRSFENGQWIAFLHVHGGWLPYNISFGARVYRATADDGRVRDFLVGWKTQWSASPNHAFTYVREKDHFENQWDKIEDWVDKNKARQVAKDETDKFFSSIVSIGGITSPEFIAILKHK